MLSTYGNRLCHFCSYNVVDIEAHFVLEYPLYKIIKNKFQSLYAKLVSWSIKSFFQLDHQADTTGSLYLMKDTALYHSKEFQQHYDILFYSHIPLAFWTPKSISFHFCILSILYMIIWSNTSFSFSFFSLFHYRNNFEIMGTCYEVNTKVFSTCFVCVCVEMSPCKTTLSTKSLHHNEYSHSKTWMYCMYERPKTWFQKTYRG